MPLLVSHRTSSSFTPLNPRRSLSAWGPVILWMALMIFGSTDLMSAEHTSRFITPFLRWLKPDISSAAIAEVHMLVRKTAHVTEYAVLTGLLFRALRGRVSGFWRRAGIAFLPAMIFAASDEYHQTFVSSRTGSPIDVLIDCCGALIGILVCRAIYLAGKWREAN